jgi:hypothetical protein
LKPKGKRGRTITTKLVSGFLESSQDFTERGARFTCLLDERLKEMVEQASSSVFGAVD